MLNKARQVRQPRWNAQLGIGSAADAPAHPAAHRVVDGGGKAQPVMQPVADLVAKMPPVAAIEEGLDIGGRAAGCCGNRHKGKALGLLGLDTVLAAHLAVKAEGGVCCAGHDRGSCCGSGDDSNAYNPREAKQIRCWYCCFKRATSRMNEHCQDRPKP